MKRVFYTFMFFLLAVPLVLNAQYSTVKLYNFPVDSGYSATWDQPDIGLDGQKGIITWTTDTTFTPWQSWEQGANVKIGHKVDPTSNGSSYFVLPSCNAAGMDHLVLSLYTASVNPFTKSGYEFYVSSETAPATKESLDMDQWTKFSDTLYNHVGGKEYNFAFPDGFGNGDLSLMIVFNTDSSENDAMKWINIWNFSVKGLPIGDEQVVKEFRFLEDSGFVATWDQDDIGIDGQNGFSTWTTDTTFTPWLSWNPNGTLKIGHKVDGTSNGPSYLVAPPFSVNGFKDLRMNVHSASNNPYSKSGYSFYISQETDPGIKEELNMDQWTKFDLDLYNMTIGTTYTFGLPSGFETADSLSLMAVFTTDSSENVGSKWINLWSFIFNGAPTEPIVKYEVTFGVVEGVEPVEGATISINGMNLVTGADGIAAVDLPDGEYDYSVTADGYEDYSGTITVAGGTVEEGIALTALDPCVQFFEFRTDLTTCDVPFAEYTWDDNINGIDGQCGYTTWVETPDTLKPWQTWGADAPQLKVGNHVNTNEFIGKAYLVFPTKSVEGCEDLKFDFEVIWDDLSNDLQYIRHKFYVSGADDFGVKESFDINEWTQIGEPLTNMDPGDEFSYVIPENFNDTSTLTFMSVLEIDDYENKGAWHWIQWTEFVLKGKTIIDTKSDDNLVSNGSISVYPNPATELLIIDGIADANSIEVFNITGASVMKRSVSSDRLTLDIDFLEEGMYLLKISGQGGSSVERFIKK